LLGAGGSNCRNKPAILVRIRAGGNPTGTIGWHCATGFLPNKMLPDFCLFQEIFGMVLKSVFAALVSAALLAWSSLSVADEYRPDQYLSLDLPSALLSPKPLGPAAQFAPGPLDVNVDHDSEGAQARAEPNAEPKAAPRIVMRQTRIVHARAETPIVHARAEKPRAATPAKLARRHGNPLDAQAFDTRIQVWPCRSGGICDWKR
jgi:hypothetical protein